MHLKTNRSNLNPGQYRFLQSTSPFVLMAGGYGAGKTIALVLKMLQLIQANPGVPGLVVAPTWSLLWSVVYRSYRKVMKLYGLNNKQAPTIIGKESYIDFGGGTHVFFRTAQNEPAIEGLDVGWSLCDEGRLITRKAKDIIIGRVRVKCPRPQRCFVSTPAMGWLSDEFNCGVEGRELIIAPTLENAAHLSPDYIEGLKLSYSPRQIRAILEGIFTILEGAVYENFDPVRTSQSFIDYNFRTRVERQKKTELAIDPGFRRSSILWIREFAPMQWIVFHQMQGEDTAMTDMVNRVNAWNHANNVDIDKIWVDPAADAREQSDGRRVMDVLKKINFRINKSIYKLSDPWRSIPLGVEKTRVLLGDVDHGQRIRLFFSKELFDKEIASQRGVIKSISSYAYPEVKDGRPVTDNPLKDGVYDHDCDAVRYWSMGKTLSDHRLRQLDRGMDESKHGPGFKRVA